MAIKIHDCDSEPKKQVPLSRNKILIVEGKDDCNFFRYFLEELGVIESIQIYFTGGKSNLEEFLIILMKQELFISKSVISIGIVQDADTDPIKTFNKIVEILKKLKLPFPKEPFEVTLTFPKISILIMPDGKNNGEIEDLCFQSIVEKDEIKCVNQYFECLVSKGIKEPVKKSRAKLIVYLASKEQSSLGVAAQKGQWDFNHVAFRQIKECLVNLFVK